jgi:hypothetical protein
MEFTNKRQQAILKALLSKTSNLKEKEGTEKVSNMMSTYDNKKAPNAHENITGEDMPRRLLGYFPYRSLGIKKNKPELMKELGFRNLKYDKKEGVRNLQGILKKTEQAWLKKELDLELLARGFQSDGLKIPSMLVLLRQNCMETSELAGVSTVLTIQNFCLNSAQTWTRRSSKCTMLKSR